MFSNHSTLRSSSPVLVILHNFLASIQQATEWSPKEYPLSLYHVDLFRDVRPNVLTRSAGQSTTDYFDGENHELIRMTG